MPCHCNEQPRGALRRSVPAVAEGVPIIWHIVALITSRRSSSKIIDSLDSWPCYLELKGLMVAVTIVRRIQSQAPLLDQLAQE